MRLTWLDTNLFTRVLRLSIPYRKYFWLSVFLGLSLSVLGPLRPYLIQLTVDDYILKYDYHGLWNISMLLIGVTILESIFRYNFIYTTSWLGQSIIKNLRVRVFRHITNLRMKFFDKTPIGVATTRTVNDVESINSIFSESLFVMAADILTLIVVMIVMFYMNWKLAFVSLATFPLLIIATYVFKEKVKVAFQEIRTQISNINAFLQEHISGMSVVQIFHAEDREYAKFEALNRRHRDENIKTVWYYALFFPVVEVILAASIGLMIWWGAGHIIDATLAPGELIAFILLLNMLFRPVRMLADKFNTLQMGLVAADRVFTLLDRDEMIQDMGALKAHHLQGEIEFRRVCFNYTENEEILHGISFKVEAGTTLAIIGSTGSGKTTIINILSRFYPIKSGQVLIDGIPIEDYELDSLRRSIGLVLQDVFLFSGSVIDNITMRDPEITKEEVIAAAKSIGAHDFITQLPGNYDFQVMERGSTLSMGQRQLISFIRVLVFNPRILILDEATSSIDTESEQLIQAAVEKLVKERTSIVIAHRLSTIQHASQIIVMDKGNIAEKGTHSELMALGKLYKKLYSLQSASK